MRVVEPFGEAVVGAFPREDPLRIVERVLVPGIGRRKRDDLAPTLHGGHVPQVDRRAERLFGGIHEFDDQFARGLVVARGDIAPYALDRGFEHLFAVEAVGESAALDVDADVVPAPLLHVLRDVVGNLRHVVAVDALESRRLVAPAADVQDIAVLPVVHAEIDEESFLSGRLACLDRNRTVAESFRSTPQVPAHHAGAGALHRTVLDAPRPLPGRPALRHVGLDGAAVGQRDLQLLVLGVRVPAAQRDLSFDLDGNRRLLERGGDIERRTVFGVHFLHLIRRAAHDAVGVEPNEVRRPHAVVDILEQRSVGGHLHQVGVALDARPTRRAGCRRRHSD